MALNNGAKMDQIFLELKRYLTSSDTATVRQNHFDLTRIRFAQ
jgi:hypothetical protein